MKIRRFPTDILITTMTIITAIVPATVAEKVPENVPTATLADLEAQLAQQQWQAANDLTWKIFNPQHSHTVDMEPIPCTTIDEVDRLWTVYSDGLYGFRVQGEIWQEITATLNTDDAENVAEEVPEDNDAVWPIFSDRIGGNLSPEEAIETAKRGYFPISDWWLTGEILTFGCGDYYCTIPRTVIEETVPAWNIVRSRWQNCESEVSFD